MIREGNIRQLTRSARVFLIGFILALSFGYGTGLYFLKSTVNLSTEGIEENYLGNEENEEAQVMKFRKSEREIMTTIHNHAISFSLIFFSLGLILLTAELSAGLKKALLLEPFLSIIVSFGGIWLMWKGLVWMKYIIMLSGILLTLSFFAIVLILLWQLVFYKENNTPSIN